MKVDIQKAITDAEAMRQTHVDWLDHLGKCEHMDQPKCVPCAQQDMASVVGDEDHHRDCIERYDNILAALAATQKPQDEEER